MNSRRVPPGTPGPGRAPRGGRPPRGPNSPMPDGRGDPCPKNLLVAFVLTLLAMARHWREVPALWRETEAHR